MLTSSAALVTLDAISAGLAFLVAGFFIASWRRSRNDLFLLHAVGFALTAIGFLAVSQSEFDPAAEATRWDALRLAGRTGGALVLVFAYASARRHGSARPLRVLAWVAAAGGALLVAFYWGVPPRASLPPLEDSLVLAHVVQLVAFLGCVVLSSSSYRREPRADLALVPGAFVAWALTQYTWILIYISDEQAIVPFVYGWRFLALALLLAALALPARRWRPASS